jgi:hypothetical protein
LTESEEVVITAGTPIITKQEAEEAILRSGYLLESRVETILIERGYYVQANDVYSDPITDKSRELDLYALKGHEVYVEPEYSYLFSVLIIECINNPQPLAFITKQPQVATLFASDMKVSGLPAKFLSDETGNRWASFDELVKLRDYHHYCVGRVATQYCSFQQKRLSGAKQQSNEWMAWHDEAQHGTFQKLCDATEYFVDKHYAEWVPGGNEENEENGDAEPINLQIYYPILVVQGELFDVQPSAGSLQIHDADHIHYMRTVIQKNEERDYHIDVVRESYFPNLLDIIEKEVSQIVGRLKRRKKVVLRSANQITREAKRLKLGDSIRQVMEYTGYSPYD